MRTAHPVRPPIHQPPQILTRQPTGASLSADVLRRALFEACQRTPNVLPDPGTLPGGAASGSGFFPIFCRISSPGQQSLTPSHEHAFTLWALGSPAFRVPLKLHQEFCLDSSLRWPLRTSNEDIHHTTLIAPAMAAKRPSPSCDVSSLAKKPSRRNVSRSAFNHVFSDL